MSTAASATAAKPASASAASGVIRTGTLGVRERTAFGGRVWKSRGVALSANSLTIHQPSRQVPLPLNSITELERTDLTDHSLSIKCAGKTYHFSFDTDADLYDWQDDIYSRCPLGGQTSNPFDFKHTAHVGADGVAGTFAQTTAMPLYEELIGRSTPGSQSLTPAAAAAAAAAPRSRSSTQAGAARRRSNPLKGTIILNNNNNVNIEGSYFVKQSGMFVGWYWKQRFLSLKGSSLTVHSRKAKASPPAKEIPLSTITSVEPDPKRSNCLFVGTAQRETCLYILFPTDGELYEWREAIYLRSGLSSDISMPTNFMHSIHVSYDRDTGELKGLPDQWKGEPSLVQPLVATISMPTSGNNGTNGRSSRRRSQPPPPRAVTEALDLSSAIASATAPSSPVAKSPSSPRKTKASLTSPSPTSPPSSSPPRFANLSRVPAPSAELAGPEVGPVRLTASASGGSTAALGTSPSSQFSGGSSVDSQNTLVSIGGSPVVKVPVLTAVQESSSAIQTR